MLKALVIQLAGAFCNIKFTFNKHFYDIMGS